MQKAKDNTKNTMNWWRALKLLFFNFPSLILASENTSFVSIHQADSILDPEADFVFIELEPYDNFTSQAFENSNQPQYARIAGQLSFPLGKIKGHQLFGVYKSTWLDRNIIYQNEQLNEGSLKRFWISGGGVIMETPKQSAVGMVGIGLNSDLADMGYMDFNSEWIYIHSLKFSDKFSIGIGADVQQYFHSYEFYPLIYMDWKIANRTKLKWDADFLEVRQFITNRFSITGGVRFNLEFFALKNDASYEYQSMGLETGFQYALGGNFYLRLKYKELVWGHENIGLPDGSMHKQDIEGGRSLRLNLAYGI